MVQTKEGASRNPWIRQIKRCAAMYHEENEARAKLPRRRLNSKSPEGELYARPKPAAAPPPAPAPQPAAPKATAPAPPKVAAAASGPELKGKDRLRKYVAAATRLLETHERVTAAVLYNELARQGDFRSAMELAGLPTKAIIASFVKAFPQFKLETSAKGGANRVVLA